MLAQAICGSSHRQARRGRSGMLAMQMRLPVARSTTDESLLDLRMPIGQGHREETCTAERGIMMVPQRLLTRRW